MEFTEAEDAAFWPVYREYEAELAKINDDRMALIKDYAMGYETLTDATADGFAVRALGLEATRTRSWSATTRASSRCSRRRRRPASSRSSTRSCCSWICKSPRRCPIASR